MYHRTLNKPMVRFGEGAVVGRWFLGRLKQVGDGFFVVGLGGAQGFVVLDDDFGLFQAMDHCVFAELAVVLAGEECTGECGSVEHHFVCRQHGSQAKPSVAFCGEWQRVDVVHRLRQLMHDVFNHELGPSRLGAIVLERLVVFTSEPLCWNVADFTLQVFGEVFQDVGLLQRSSKGCGVLLQGDGGAFVPTVELCGECVQR